MKYLNLEHSKKRKTALGLDDPSIVRAAAEARVAGRRARAKTRGEHCECGYVSSGSFLRCRWCTESGMRYLPRYVPGALQCWSLHKKGDKWYRCERADGHEAQHSWGSVLSWSVGDQRVRVVCGVCKTDVITVRNGDDDPPWYVRCPICNEGRQTGPVASRCTMQLMPPPDDLQPFASGPKEAT